MNNQPVAWMALNQLNNTYSAFTDSDKERMLPHVQQLYANWIPLYTHPAKTLTDEEIAQAWAETKGDILHRLVPFARAILRKAQEK